MRRFKIMRFDPINQLKITDDMTEHELKSALFDLSTVDEVIDYLLPSTWKIIKELPED